jgi:hypothetical protein
MSIFKSPRRVGLLLVAFMFVLMGTSCGGRARFPAYPVKGLVRFEGKPVEGARVFFHPREKTASPIDSYLPSGIVDADGSFELTTYEEGDGAPVGEYEVTITRRTEQAKSDEDGDDLIPPLYGSPGTSPLRATVEATTNNLKPFILTSQGWHPTPRRPSKGDKARGSK